MVMKEVLWGLMIPFAGTTAGLWFHQDVPFIYPGDILIVKES